MTNERKAELFDSALNVIFSRMKFYDETEYEEVLQEIGFTAEEIDEMLRDIARAFEEDEPSSLDEKINAAEKDRDDNTSFSEDKGYHDRDNFR